MEVLSAIDRKSKWRSSFSFIHVYTAYVSVGKTLKPSLLYGLSIGKLLVIGRDPKQRSSFSHSCLYSVCKRGKSPNMAIAVWTFYGKVVGNQSEAIIAVEIFSDMPIQRTKTSKWL